MVSNGGAVSTDMFLAAVRRDTRAGCSRQHPQRFYVSYVAA